MTKRNTSIPLLMNTTGKNTQLALCKRYSMFACEKRENFLLCTYLSFIISILPERLTLNVNQGRVPMTAMTVQSAWRQNGIASILATLSLMEMNSGSSSSPMTTGTSRKQKRVTCWFTNVKSSSDL